MKLQGRGHSAFPLHTGVPQGSVLGSLLFLCYVQPFRASQQHLVSCHGYAEDTQQNEHVRHKDAASLCSAVKSMEACAVMGEHG